MTDAVLSSSLTSIAHDYAAIRQQLLEQAVDHKLLREEVNQLRARLAVLELESTHAPPTTLGQAATPGTNWEWTGQDTSRDDDKANL